MHTPGPWKADSFGKLNRPFVMVGMNCREVLYMPVGKLAEQQANANLIAAAPELLEALKGLLVNAPQPDKDVKKSYHYLVHIEAAKKAIAKAEGTHE